MKKILWGTLFLCPALVWGQSLSLENIDIESALSCDRTTIQCQVEIETTKQLVQALLVQILAAQLAGDVSNETPYWLEKDYLDELEENPLKRGRTKTFRLDDGEIDDIEEEHAVYREMWRIFSLLLDTEQLELFDEITFYNSTSDQYAALVYQQVESRNGRESEEWDLKINLDNLLFKNDREYNDTVETLVHEAGHFLLMNAAQMDFFEDEEDCNTYFVPGLESCAKEDSYYAHLAEYWDQDFIDWGHNFLDYFREDPDQAEQDLRDYYDRHQEEFVSEYAASGPDEDAAETIAHFAVHDLPTGSLLVAEEKTVLFYDFAEMVALRQEVQEILR